MKERSLIIIIFLALIVVPIGYMFLMPFLNFTFSDSTISVVGKNIEEKLSFSPSIKEYHTLYRNFITPTMNSSVSTLSWYIGDFIYLKEVSCSSGNPYINYYSESPTIPYTEENEYGCSFGRDTGFKRGNSYTISANFTLFPSTLIHYNNEYYIKFVAYSEGQHPLLVRDMNFHVNGISSKLIMPNQPVIVYIPVDSNDFPNYKIIETSSLSFSNSSMFELFMLIVPALIVLLVWLFFGRENKEGDYPEELSQPPLNERKIWEVAVYFHPPFGDLDQNFLPAMLMDLYNRKRITIQMRKEGLLIKSDEVYIKILKADGLDEVEKQVMTFLELISSFGKDKDGYFSIKKNSNSFSGGISVSKKFKDLQKALKKKSKDYVSYTGTTLTYILLMIWFVSGIMFAGFSTYYIFLIFIIVGFVLKKTSLFYKFKGNYYLEYQQWQGFNKYLATLDSIKRSPPKGIILWEKYLVYATAMGSGKKVLQAMKDLRIIDERTYNSYMIIYSPVAFGNAGGAASGRGGMGGGGMGGGGGGGR